MLHEKQFHKISVLVVKDPQDKSTKERFNRTMHNLLRCLEDSQKRKWPDHIREMCFIYNSTPHASTGYSPFFLYFGMKPVLPIDNLFNLVTKEVYENMDDWVRSHHQRMLGHSSWHIGGWRPRQKRGD